MMCGSLILSVCAVLTLKLNVCVGCKQKTSLRSWQICFTLTRFGVAPAPIESLPRCSEGVELVHLQGRESCPLTPFLCSFWGGSSAGVELPYSSFWRWSLICANGHAFTGKWWRAAVQINMQVNAQLIQERFNKLAEQIQSRALAEPKAILNSTALPSSEQQLPNGETLPEPPAAMNLQSGTGRRVSKGDRQKRDMTMRAFLPLAVLRIVVPPKGGRQKHLKRVEKSH